MTGSQTCPSASNSASTAVPKSGTGRCAAQRAGRRQVRVRNHAIGLNFIDTYFRGGLYQPPSLPSGLGVEGAGVVDAVGEGVQHAAGRPGRYATVRWVPTRSITRCRLATGQAAGLHQLRTGCRGHAQGPDLSVSAASDSRAASRRDRAVPCRGRRRWLHCLPVGARARRSADRRGWLGGEAARAQALGAWATIDRSCEDVVQRVLELTEGKKCPVVYDSVGKNSWEISLDCVARAGCW